MVQFQFLGLPYCRPEECVSRCLISFSGREVPQPGPSQYGRIPVPTPNRGDVQLNSASQSFLRSALNTSTRASYASGVRALHQFAVLHNSPCFHGLPVCPTEELFILFVTHCATVRNLTHATIKLYLSGIRSQFIEQGLGDPYVLPFNTPMLKLQQVMKGIKKTKHSKPLPRLPITGDILHSMCLRLKNSLFGPYWDDLMTAAVTTAFYGFLRCGEFTTSSERFDPSCDLSREDIQPQYTGCNVNEISVLLKSSKTDPFRHGSTISLFRINGITCPITALLTFTAARDSVCNNPTSPFFLLPSGRPLTRKIFLDLLSRLCSAVELDPKKYSGHSFRIGAATTAAKKHIPDHMVRVLGRWSSDAYTSYVRTDKSSLNAAHQTLAKCFS